MSIDILDIRDIAQEWSDEIDEGEVTRDYSQLCEDLGIEATPDALREYGEMQESALISDSSFVEYAKELAEDIGAVNADATWPNNYIDWERATDALRQDYTTVRFEGTDYLVRA